MPRLIAKTLTCKFLIRLAKAILMSLLRELAARSSNTLDDSLIDAVEAALKEDGD